MVLALLVSIQNQKNGRDNNEQATDEEILIRDGVVVVVDDSETR
jgi:hypothetical protein